MRCTDCSATVLPIVAVDIDGTLGDYHTHYIDFMARYFRRPDLVEAARQYAGGLPGDFGRYLRDLFEIPESEWRAAKLAYRQGGAKRSMPLMQGAAAFMLNLSTLNVEVFVTTTRPYLRHDQTDPDTRFWLLWHGFMYDGLIFDEYKYQSLRQTVDPKRVIAIVDDLPEMYDSAEEHFGPDVPIMVRSRYNADISRPNLLSDLGQTFAVIEERLAKWVMIYG